MSSDGLVVAVPTSDILDSVQVLDWSSGDNEWVQRGDGIQHIPFQNGRILLSLSSNGSIVAIGNLRDPSGTKPFGGGVYVFRWKTDDSEWTQIKKEVVTSLRIIGYLEMSSDGSTIAIGSFLTGNALALQHDPLQD